MRILNERLQKVMYIKGVNGSRLKEYLQPGRLDLIKSIL